MEPPSVYWISIHLLNLKACKIWKTINWNRPLLYSIHWWKCPKLEHAGHVYSQINQNNPNILSKTEFCNLWLYTLWYINTKINKMTYLFPRSITRLIFWQSFNLSSLTILVTHTCLMAEWNIMQTIWKCVTQNKRVLKVMQITENSLCYSFLLACRVLPVFWQWKGWGNFN